MKSRRKRSRIEPLVAGPVPPGVTRACKRMAVIDLSGTLALVDEIMATNPDFLRCALSMTHAGVSHAKVEAGVRVACFLELCHRELKRRPMPRVTEEEVGRHYEKVCRHFGALSEGLDPAAAVDPVRSGLLKGQKQMHVVAWVFHMLGDAGVMEMRGQSDVEVVITCFALLSVYNEAFQPGASGA
jgi:hypothetical protein